VELTFPITACNLMIEFAEYYDNTQVSEPYQPISCCESVKIVKET